MLNVESSENKITLQHVVAYLQSDLMGSDQINETVHFDEINDKQGRKVNLFLKDMFR